METFRQLLIPFLIKVARIFLPNLRNSSDHKHLKISQSSPVSQVLFFSELPFSHYENHSANKSKNEYFAVKKFKKPKKQGVL